MCPSSVGDVSTTTESTVRLLKKSQCSKFFLLWIVRDCNGSTLLHLAATNGSTHIVDTLLNMAGLVFYNKQTYSIVNQAFFLFLSTFLIVTLRVDIDVKDEAERTPLHYCCIAGHADITQLLLTFGALDACFDSQGSIITHLPLSLWAIIIVLFSRFTALHYALQSNSSATVEGFAQVANLSHLPDANEGRTPLMNAAQNASHTMLKVNQLPYSPHNAKETDNIRIHRFCFKTEQS